MKNIIETEALTKRFGRFTAVENVSIRIKRGEIYGFLGLNGAGKTTTIRMLLGLIRPTSGRAVIFGEEISPRTGPWHRIGSLIEIPYSYPELTVKENLEIIRRMRGISNPDSVKKIIEKLKLTRYMERKAGHLSLGNSQRLGLAKALLHNPELLILDEPSNGLDPAGIVEVRELLMDLAKNNSVTIFVSSHILDEISRLATRIGIIHEGSLLKEMDTMELQTMRRKFLCIKTRNNIDAMKLLTSKGYSIRNKEGESLELYDDHALQRPDYVASLLALSDNPPIALYEEKENLETYFLRIIRQSEEA